MTHLVDLTAPIPSSLRRHTDPPALWVAVLSISIALHLIVLWLLTGFMVRLQNVGVGGATIPVDVVELPSTSKSAATSQKPLGATRKSNITRTSTRKTTVHHAVLPTAKATPPGQITHLSTAAPPSKPFPGNRTTAKPTATPFGKPTPITPLSIGSPQSNPSPSGNARSNKPFPLPPKPNQSPFPQKPTPPRGTSSSQGKGVSGSIVNSQLGNGGRDIPDVPAKPKGTSQKFGQWSYSAQLRGSFGQVVVFKVLIKSTGGKPAQISLLQSSRNSQYDDLAKRLLQTWNFDPATSNRQPVDSFLDVSLKINSL